MHSKSSSQENQESVVKESVKKGTNQFPTIHYNSSIDGEYKSQT